MYTRRSVDNLSGGFEQRKAKILDCFRIIAMCRSHIELVTYLRGCYTPGHLRHDAMHPHDFRTDSFSVLKGLRNVFGKESLAFVYSMQIPRCFILKYHPCGLKLLLNGTLGVCGVYFEIVYASPLRFLLRRAIIISPGNPVVSKGDKR